MRLRVWSEFLSFEDLGRPALTKLLARFDCGLLLRLGESQLHDGAAAALRACADAGVPDLGLWLLLDDEQGYWPSERNAEQVRRLVERAIEWRQPVSWLAIDLEPPLWQARALASEAGFRKLACHLRFARANLDPARFESALGLYREVIDVAHAAGLKVLCAAHDYLAEDVWLGQSVLQDLHEAPVLGLPWDRLSVMLYGSMMALSPTRARRWMHETALALASCGIPLGASIGLTGVGVLGNEGPYTRPAELAHDAAALKSAGVDDFAIYNLEGILASEDPAAWFQAVIDAAPQVPPASAPVRWQRRKRQLLALVVAAYRSRLARDPGRAR